MWQNGSDFGEFSHKLEVGQRISRFGPALALLREAKGGETPQRS